MKRFLSFIIIISLFLPNLIKAEKYSEPKAWGYFGIGEGGIALPSGLYGRYFPVAMGFGPPIGLGIGTAYSDGVVPLKCLGCDIVSYRFPLYIYWVPYMKAANFYTIAAMYIFFGFSTWTKTNYNFFRCGIGLGGSEIFGGGNLEVGYMHYNAAANSLYIGGILSLSSWLGLGVERIPSPTIFQFSADFKDADGDGILSGNEKGILNIYISNKEKEAVQDVKLSISISKVEVPLLFLKNLSVSLENVYKDKITYKNHYYIGEIKPLRRKHIKLPINAKGKLLKGKIIIKITCNYKTKSGKKKTEYKKVSINTAP